MDCLQLQAPVRPDPCRRGSYALSGIIGYNDPE